MTGLLHPLSLPGEMLTLVAFGLILGANPAAAKPAWQAFAVASTATLALASPGWIALDAEPLLLALALACGLAIALAGSLPQAAAQAAGVGTGFAAGLVSVPDPGTAAAMAVSGIGALFGANIILSYVGGGLIYLRGLVTWSWLPVALRVLGSWIAAVSLLLGALLLR